MQAPRFTKDRVGCIAGKPCSHNPHNDCRAVFQLQDSCNRLRNSPGMKYCCPHPKNVRSLEPFRRLLRNKRVSWVTRASIGTNWALTTSRPTSATCRTGAMAPGTRAP
ncbi:hypothetical protein B0E42_23390 [Pseudomonas sp. A25(2017)]|nr:hypothetical protein B0E42_23390 [Pseudomonas sp. A25(2017)]